MPNASAHNPGAERLTGVDSHHGNATASHSEQPEGAPTTTPLGIGSRMRAIDQDFADIRRTVAAFAAGDPVVVVDDENRENEGDLIVAGALATPETVGMLVRYTSGLICAPITQERAEEMQLPLMVTDSEDPKRTAYTISCDARFGTSTGISAHDRCAAVRVLADETSGADQLQRPGHVLPLIARPGGVLERAGHTEAAIDLCRLAGLPLAAAIGEVVHDDGSMMRLDALRSFAAEHGLQIMTIERLQQYLRLSENTAPRALNNGEAGGAAYENEADHAEADREAGVRLRSVADPATEPERDALPAAEHSGTVELPTGFGAFSAEAWALDGAEHISLTAPVPDTTEAPLVRLHSECVTGDVLGSHRCDCGEQLHAALAKIHAEGGALIYLRDHEGRGIGLLNKLRAYELQQAGADTVDANEMLGLPVDARSYTAAAAILRALGLQRVRLLTNNPDKVAGLRDAGIDVVGVVPLEVPARPENIRYLQTKRDRMHHLLHVEGVQNV